MPSVTGISARLVVLPAACGGVAETLPPGSSALLRLGGSICRRAGREAATLRYAPKLLGGIVLHRPRRAAEALPIGGTALLGR
ncbi:MAG: hypothetical protein M3Z09_12810, partial [Acidobacteriota bacterium]|nr:hypothetical protein [Acidobacteriota bacterium]